ncbi:hypothetical protein RA280_14800 [Cupriavidus sp. CV2]|uniref:hypothetical protein n=1 Tax=Cupriavidus ulmosensis TaxID=3065913 RepID=UPI00296B24FF|nr:hypothetical protein [Cupriavidus sp. CV2]MDW3682994.1 hypothetical protein [Cupriavidus sp. CV2]
MLSFDVERALAELTSIMLRQPLPGLRLRDIDAEARHVVVAEAGIGRNTTLYEAEKKLQNGALRFSVAAEAALRRFDALCAYSPASAARDRATPGAQIEPRIWREALVEFHIAARRARTAWDMYYSVCSVVQAVRAR